MEPEGLLYSQQHALGTEPVEYFQHNLILYFKIRLCLSYLSLGLASGLLHSSFR
jgi:hypothetical protein